MGSVVDPELLHLAGELPELMLDRWSDNTNKSYLGAYKKFQLWAKKFAEICQMPVSPGHLCIYLVHLGQLELSISSITAVIAGISWAHHMCGCSSPTDNVTVKSTVTGLKRRLSKPRSVSSPILPTHIEKIVSQSDLSDLQELRVVCVILLSYAGFLRFNEVSSIRSEHLSFSSTHLEIFLPKAKNDQFRQGQTVFITRLHNENCPVALTERYIEVANMDIKIHQFLFKNMQFKNGKVILSNIDKAMTYTRTKEVVQKKFIQIGLDKQSYKLHSLRAGGTTAACNSHLPDRFVQRHGRWRSDAVKNRYVTDSLEDLLSVSKNLGL